MAPPAGQIRPGRYLAFFLFIVVLLYALVFATPDHRAVPKLGIDLQGGTRVTLTARTANGGVPPKESLEQARQIIETRVNGIGVQGTEVVLDGSNIVITVPGEEGEQAKDLGQTAQLRFREVVGQPIPAQPQEQPQPPSRSSRPRRRPRRRRLDRPARRLERADLRRAAGQAGARSGRSRAPRRPQPPASGTSGAPEGAGRPARGVRAVQAGVPDLLRPTSRPARKARSRPPQLITLGKACRQAPQLAPSKDGTVQPDQAVQQAAVEATTCTKGTQVGDPLVGNDDPKKPLVACDQDATAKYILGPSFLSGTQISDANSAVNPQGVGYVVNLDFKSDGSKTWADYTTANVGKQAAFVLDSQVVSAPSIREAISGGSTTISGGGQGGFTADEARSLAEVLKYGSLPLSFDSSEAETVSATLGLASLQAGLIAGAIGLLLVFIYCLFYYRMLGILTALSLVCSGAIVFAVLVLLGRWIGFTLDLAGVAGFIVAIGITADSFVVFFERLKDEIREGRTFRSAVPRAWVRARRTILSADAVMFLAAAVLYVLAVGQVKGFAFTLGMSTVLDLVVVFFVTHPLVAMASKSKMLSNPRFSGLGAVQRLASDRRKAAGTAVKEA